MDVNITKEQFESAYIKFSPNKWTKFAFRYFSQETLPWDKWLKRWVNFFMILFTLSGFVLTVVNAPNIFIGISLGFTGILLVLLAILLFGAKIMNNLRIFKIMKFLKITYSEYEILLDKYCDLPCLLNE